MNNLECRNHVTRSLNTVGVLCRTIPKGLATAAISISIFLAACGDDNKNAGGTVEDQEIIAITDKTISGVSQKGPFVNGSSVTVQELDGETLAQTGNSYEGKIKNDMGEFSVKVTKLASQYALLKANGFYSNEVTGEKSKSQVTLYALTDISNRDEVNVNLLTHLEYERSLYLAADDSVTVAAAKKQAEKEVLATFGITGDFANSEDLNIFGTDDGAAALLAVSVLMQGDLSEADFSERLADYAADIETDGMWGDSKTATKIADWASSKSLSGDLENIRNNIAKWDISTDVPAFEKYVDNFWWQNYGLGTCDKKRDGEVLQNSNTQSGANGVHFICKSGAWIVASDIEKDTATWGTGKNGEVRAGVVNRDFYYIYDSNKKAWQNATTIEKDTYNYTKNEDWDDGFNGEIRKGAITDSFYVYDSTAWRIASNVEKSLGGCVTAIQDSIGKVLNSYYICNSQKWEKATELQYDTYKQKCTKFGQITHGIVNKDFAYFCYGEKWKRFYGNESITYEKLVDERDNQIYRTVKIGDQTWIAENLNYEIEGSSCAGGKARNLESGKCDVYGRLYNWDQAQTICPKNYHLPSSEEYETLFIYAGGEKTRNCEYLYSEKEGGCVSEECLKCENGIYGNFEWIGEYFKAKSSLWNTLYDLTKMDKYGFSVLPAGVYYTDAQGYDGEREMANFWTSSGEDLEQPVVIQFATQGNTHAGQYMTYENEVVDICGSFRTTLVSVRCVKDEEE